MCPFISFYTHQALCTDAIKSPLQALHARSFRHWMHANPLKQFNLLHTALQLNLCFTSIALSVPEPCALNN